MSIYKPKNSPFYQYDFECRGHRFHGSTKCTSRREAEAVERTERERARQRLTEMQAASGSLKLDDVIDRYWNEVGQYHIGKQHTFHELELLIDYLGATTLLTEITDDDVTKLVAWRRGHRDLRNKKRKPEDCPLISNATVNATTAVLRKVFNRAKRNWKIRFDREPNWRDHFLSEPEERVRELVGDEGDRLEAATPQDFLPFFAFVRASGMRFKECVLLRWTEVNWTVGQITKIGKGGRRITCPITPTICAILEPLQGDHPEMVFTRRHGENRYPLSLSSVKRTWQRLRKKASVTDFRFHDFRHDLATKLLRKTGNLKLVQKALNHTNILTTTRYAHVLSDEVADALEQVAQDRRSERNRRNESRTNPRTTNRKLG